MDVRFPPHGPSDADRLAWAANAAADSADSANSPSVPINIAGNDDAAAFTPGVGQVSTSPPSTPKPRPTPRPPKDCKPRRGPISSTPSLQLSSSRIFANIATYPQVSFQGPVSPPTAAPLPRNSLVFDAFGITEDSSELALKLQMIPKTPPRVSASQAAVGIATTFSTGQAPQIDMRSQIEKVNQAFTSTESTPLTASIKSPSRFHFVQKASSLQRENSIMGISNQPPAVAPFAPTTSDLIFGRPAAPVVKFSNPFNSPEPQAKTTQSFGLGSPSNSNSFSFANTAQNNLGDIFTSVPMAHNSRPSVPSPLYTPPPRQTQSASHFFGSIAPAYNSNTQASSITTPPIAPTTTITTDPSLTSYVASPTQLDDSIRVAQKRALEITTVDDEGGLEDIYGASPKLRPTPSEPEQDNMDEGISEIDRFVNSLQQGISSDLVATTGADQSATGNSADTCFGVPLVNDGESVVAMHGLLSNNLEQFNSILEAESKAYGSNGTTDTPGVSFETQNSYQSSSAFSLQTETADDVTAEDVIMDDNEWFERFVQIMQDPNIQDDVVMNEFPAEADVDHQISRNYPLASSKDDKDSDIEIEDVPPPSSADPTNLQILSVIDTPNTAFTTVQDYTRNVDADMQDSPDLEAPTQVIGIATVAIPAGVEETMINLEYSDSTSAHAIVVDLKDGIAVSMAYSEPATLETILENSKPFVEDYGDLSRAADPEEDEFPDQHLESKLRVHVVVEEQEVVSVSKLIEVATIIGAPSEEILVVTVHEKISEEHIFVAPIEPTEPVAPEKTIDGTSIPSNEQSSVPQDGTSLPLLYHPSFSSPPVEPLVSKTCPRILATIQNYSADLETIIDSMNSARLSDIVGDNEIESTNSGLLEKGEVEVRQPYGNAECPNFNSHPMNPLSTPAVEKSETPPVTDLLSEASDINLVATTPSNGRAKSINKVKTSKINKNPRSKNAGTMTEEACSVFKPCLHKDIIDDWRARMVEANEVARIRKIVLPEDYIERSVSDIQSRRHYEVKWRRDYQEELASRDVHDLQLESEIVGLQRDRDDLKLALRESEVHTKLAEYWSVAGMKQVKSLEAKLLEATDTIELYKDRFARKIRALKEAHEKITKSSKDTFDKDAKLSKDTFDEEMKSSKAAFDKERQVWKKEERALNKEADDLSDGYNDEVEKLEKAHAKKEKELWEEYNTILLKQKSSLSKFEAGQQKAQQDVDRANKEAESAERMAGLERVPRPGSGYDLVLIVKPQIIQRVQEQGEDTEIASFTVDDVPETSLPEKSETPTSILNGSRRVSSLIHADSSIRVKPAAQVPRSHEEISGAEVARTITEGSKEEISFTNAVCTVTPTSDSTEVESDAVKQFTTETKAQNSLLDASGENTISCGDLDLNPVKPATADSSEDTIHSEPKNGNTSMPILETLTTQPTTETLDIFGLLNNTDVISTHTDFSQGASSSETQSSSERLISAATPVPAATGPIQRARLPGWLMRALLYAILFLTTIYVAKMAYSVPLTIPKNQIGNSEPMTVDTPQFSMVQTSPSWEPTLLGTPVVVCTEDQTPPRYLWDDYVHSAEPHGRQASWRDNWLNTLTWVVVSVTAATSVGRSMQGGRGGG
ncbi:uncharacterized protein RCO7_09274 [Rhynchosporium graminicola]|uniref:Uncharacterized protein n=1 Tax=Rhynchosporium graminicola TaxID=2792576 RepID=A0A1E1KYC8_9HELO|nr:uncharacterized protein RCO7_09274 [Rhynchosporium commune]